MGSTIGPDNVHAQNIIMNNNVNKFKSPLEKLSEKIYNIKSKTRPGATPYINNTLNHDLNFHKNNLEQNFKHINPNDRQVILLTDKPHK